MFSRDCENDVWSAPSPAALEGKSPQTIERDRRLYVFAANMSGKGARGPLARTAVERILTERGLL